MTITATEFKAHFGKYPELAKTEDFFFTKNNKKVAKLTAPSVDSKTSLDRIVGAGSAFTDMTLDDIKKERLGRECS